MSTASGARATRLLLRAAPASGRVRAAAGARLGTKSATGSVRAGRVGAGRRADARRARAGALGGLLEQRSVLLAPTARTVHALPTPVAQVVQAVERRAKLSGERHAALVARLLVQHIRLNLHLHAYNNCQQSIRVQ